MKKYRNYIKNKRQITANKKSISNSFSLILKLNLAIALFLLLATIAAAEPVIVKAGNLNVSNDLLVNTNTLYADSANNNVGIGTTSPATTLHIAKSGEPAQVLDSFNPTQGNAGYLGFRKSRHATIGSHTVVASGDDLMIIDAQGSNGSSYISAARIWAEVDGTPGSADMPGRLLFSTTADGSDTLTERMRIDSSGNIGIGDTTPSQKLEVKGRLRIQATAQADYMEMYDSGSVSYILSSVNPIYIDSDSDIRLLAQETGHDIYIDANDFIKLRNNGADVMTLDGGNVGIGTTSPDQKLKVVGSLNVTGDIHMGGSLIPYSPVMLGKDDDVGYSRMCLYDEAGYWNLVWFKDGAMQLAQNSSVCIQKEEKSIARRVCENSNLLFNATDLSCYQQETINQTGLGE